MDDNHCPFPLRTEATDALGCHAPLIVPPMANVSSPELVAAVTRMGCFGFFASGYLKDPKVLKDDIAKFKSLCGHTAPFGIGFITWATSPLMFKSALEENPQALWFSFGDSAGFINQARAKLPECKILVQVQTVSEAIVAVDEWGADGIVAQGREAGGHGNGNGGSVFVLVPEIVDAVGDRCFVISAGGIMDGRGMAAALMLGASAVAMGTIFSSSKESRVHPAAKIRLVEVSDGSRSTTRTQLYEPLRRLEWPHQYDFRVLRNPVTEDTQPKHESRWRTAFDKELAAAQAGKKPDFDVLPICAGEGVGLIKGIWNAELIVERTLAQLKDSFQLAGAAVDRNKSKL